MGKQGTKIKGKEEEDVRKGKIAGRDTKRLISDSGGNNKEKVAGCGGLRDGNGDAGGKRVKRGGKGERG